MSNWGTWTVKAKNLNGVEFSIDVQANSAESAKAAVVRKNKYNTPISAEKRTASK